METVKYLVEGTVSHVFASNQAKTPLCGKEPSWYGSTWQNDVAGLKARRICKKCEQRI